MSTLIKTAKWDIFISHASEDKEQVVRPLSELLSRLGLRVWYDEFSLKAGDSLTGSIDKGLRDSKYGLVVLSHAFFSKAWPAREVRGLTSLEADGKERIIPLWYKVGHVDVAHFSPTLSDRVAIVMVDQPIQQVALKIMQIVRPDIIDALSRRARFDELAEKAPRKKVNLSELKWGPVVHDDLSAVAKRDVRLIRAALLEVFPKSLKSWMDGFQRDIYPDREIKFWQHLASVYLEYVSDNPELTHEEKRNIVRFMIEASAAQEPTEFMINEMSMDTVDRLTTLWQQDKEIYK